MTVKIDGTNTEANPAFTGADTDTGLQCGTDELKLVTGGTARATVDSSGRLLVGATSAAIGSKMDVHAGSDGANIFGVTGADQSSEFLALGVTSSEAILTAGNASSNGTSLVFKTANSSGTETERMRINSAGQITTPNQPSFQAQRSGSYGQSGTDDFAPYNSTKFNRGNHYSTSTYRFTAPVAGHYLFFANAHRAANNFGSIQILKNNSTRYSFTEFESFDNNAHHYTIAIVDLGVNDYVNVQGTNYNMDQNNFFGGYLLG